MARDSRRQECKGRAPAMTFSCQKDDDLDCVESKSNSSQIGALVRLLTDADAGRWNAVVTVF